MMRVEHWDNAIDQGAHAARTLLAGDGGGRAPTRPCRGSGPTSTTARSSSPAGPGPTTRCAVVPGSLEERRFVALFGRAGRVVAAFGMNRPAPIMRYRSRIAEGLEWDVALAEAEAEAKAG